LEEHPLHEFHSHRLRRQNKKKAAPFSLTSPRFSPYQFMQLQLHADGEAITQYPSCQGFRREGIMHWRKQDRTNLIQPIRMQCRDRPQIVSFIAQHKLDLVM
jgi:hypothetical protein